MGIGLASGVLLSSETTMMGSAMIFGLAYMFAMCCGAVFCVVALLFVLITKIRYRILLKKNLIIVISSAFILYVFPFIFLNAIKMVFW